MQRLGLSQAPHRRSILVGDVVWLPRAATFIEIEGESDDEDTEEAAKDRLGLVLSEEGSELLVCAVALRGVCCAVAVVLCLQPPVLVHWCSQPRTPRNMCCAPQ
jgi:hypothetical protein